MKIFVAGLNFKLGDTDLENLFRDYGTVSLAKVIVDRSTGQSKGYGFVEMEDGEAVKAISALNGTEFSGRTIYVSEARPREEKRNFDGRGRS